MTDLDKAWALARIDDALDGTLARHERARLRELVAGDPDVRAAFEQARVMQRELRSLARTPAPASSLLMRLARIPAARRRARKPAFASFGSWSSAGIAAAALVAAVAVLLPRTQPHPGEAALRDFRIAMIYLQRSYEVAGRKVVGATGRGLSDALSLEQGNQGNGG